MLVLLAQSAAEAVISISVTQFTYYRWGKEFGGLKTDQVNGLEKENERLWKAVSISSLRGLSCQSLTGKMPARHPRRELALPSFAEQPEGHHEQQHR